MLDPNGARRRRLKPALCTQKKLKSCEMNRSRARAPVVNRHKQIRAVRVGGGYATPREVAVLQRQSHAPPPVATHGPRARHRPKRP